MRLLLLLLALLQPDLRAYWDGPGAATVSWTQTQRGCLYRQNAIGEKVFVSCYEKPGSYRIEFGHVGPLSGDLRPTAGDRYCLVQGSTVACAPLVGRPVYFPVFRG